MKLPRDLSSDVTTSENGTHQITIPAHNPVKIGTLNNILRDVALHFNLSKDELLKRLF